MNAHEGSIRKSIRSSPDYERRLRDLVPHRTWIAPSSNPNPIEECKAAAVLQARKGGAKQYNRGIVGREREEEGVVRP